MLKVSDFKAIKLALASPEEILGWSHGEVTKSRDDQLPDAAREKGRTVLREDFRSGKGLGVLLRQIQEDPL